MMLKKLGPRAISYITEILNDILKTSMTSPIWKTGRNILLLKLGKPADKGKSYRSIFLPSSRRAAIFLGLDMGDKREEDQARRRANTSTVPLLHNSPAFPYQTS